MVMRILSVLSFVAVLGAGPAVADTLTDRLIAQLAEQGFSSFEVSRTWLGRVRIQAEGEGLSREVIVNPRTGEILRDLWTRDDAESTPELFDPTQAADADDDENVSLGDTSGDDRDAGDGVDDPSGQSDDDGDNADASDDGEDDGDASGSDESEADDGDDGGDDGGDDSTSDDD